jgi:hypothetical protein
MFGRCYTPIPLLDEFNGGFSTSANNLEQKLEDGEYLRGQSKRTVLGVICCLFLKIKKKKKIKIVRRLLHIKE